MVKANGYGHGAAAIAKTLAAAGSDAFGVATLEEGVELRQAGVQQPIIVLAGMYLDQIEQFLAHQLTPVVHELAHLKELDTALLSAWRCTQLPFENRYRHGPARPPRSRVESWFPELKTLRALKLDGMFSHFSHAESVEGDYTQTTAGNFHRSDRATAC